MTLTNLAAPIAALCLLTTSRGTASLPAPTVEVTPIYPEQLHLAFHDTGGFEEWLDALGIDRADVTEAVQSGGTTRVRKAATAYAGADIQLVSYTTEEAP